MQFSLRSLFFLTAIVAVYFLLRQFILHNQVWLAYALPPSIAVLSGLYAAIGSLRGEYGVWRCSKRGAFLGAATGTAATVALLMEITHLAGPYWTWRRDWLFAAEVVGGEMLVTGLAGAVFAAIGRSVAIAFIPSGKTEDA